MKTFLISLFLLLVAGQALDSSEKAEPVTHDRHVPWGVYEMLTRRYSWEERLDHAAEDFGAQPRYVLFFRDLNPRR
ncbi:MAG: hypothetical protein KJT03_13980, partial [Verrucomicrobiae bacterium]|nr:hypothetical protein [Verrucomicrobiae bacterium]